MSGTVIDEDRARVRWRTSAPRREAARGGADVALNAWMSKDSAEAASSTECVHARISPASCRRAGAFIATPLHPRLASSLFPGIWRLHPAGRFSQKLLEGLRKEPSRYSLLASLRSDASSVGCQRHEEGKRNAHRCLLAGLPQWRALARHQKLQASGPSRPRAACLGCLLLALERE